MTSLESLHREARKYSRKVPVPPLQVIIDKDYLTLYTLLNMGEEGLTVRQNTLDSAVAEGRTMRASAGIKTKIVYWDGMYGVVAGFNHEGIQVGYGQALWEKDPRNREISRQMMAYFTAYVVSSGFEGRGLGFAMMDHLENFVASNNIGIGATFFYNVQAETEDRRAAARRMIQKIKARPYPPTPYFIRLALKSRYSKGEELGMTKVPDSVPVYTTY